MNIENVLAAIGDSFIYLAERLSERCGEPQTAAQRPEPVQQVTRPQDFPRPTNEEHLLEKIRAGGQGGIATAYLTRHSRSMTNFERKTAVRKLIELGFVRQETIRTDGRPKVVLIASPA